MVLRVIRTIGEGEEVGKGWKIATENNQKKTPKRDKGRKVDLNPEGGGELDRCSIWGEKRNKHFSPCLLQKEGDIAKAPIRRGGSASEWEEGEVRSKMTRGRARRLRGEKGSTDRKKGLRMKGERAMYAVKKNNREGIVLGSMKKEGISRITGKSGVCRCFYASKKKLGER